MTGCVDVLLTRTLFNRTRKRLPVLWLGHQSALRPLCGAPGDAFVPQLLQLGLAQWRTACFRQIQLVLLERLLQRLLRFVNGVSLQRLVENRLQRRGGRGSGEVSSAAGRS